MGVARLAHEVETRSSHPRGAPVHPGASALRHRQGELLGSHWSVVSFQGTDQREDTQPRDISEAMQWLSVASSQHDCPRAKDVFQAGRTQAPLVSEWPWLAPVTPQWARRAAA